VAKQAQKHEALRRHFAEQLGFIRTSMKAYDDGQQVEAKRIAVILRTLLHDTATSPVPTPTTPKRGSSHALLVQLGWRDQWQWADTAGALNERGLLSISNLAPLHLGSDFAKLGQFNQRPHAMLENMRTAGIILPREPGYFISFEEWWTMPVIRDKDLERFSRKDLVLAVANTDGGAHVDPGLNDAYYRLSRSNSFGWVLQDESGNTTDIRASPVFPSIRQIAEELIYTLNQFWQPPPGVPDPRQRHTKA
jgi:hypothetical protein